MAEAPTAKLIADELEKVSKQTNAGLRKIVDGDQAVFSDDDFRDFTLSLLNTMGDLLVVIGTELDRLRGRIDALEGDG